MLSLGRIGLRTVPNSRIRAVLELIFASSLLLGFGSSISSTGTIFNGFKFLSSLTTKKNFNVT